LMFSISQNLKNFVSLPCFFMQRSQLTKASGVQDESRPDFPSKSKLRASSNLTQKIEALHRLEAELCAKLYYEQR
ncbi:MAG: hypothetical protein ACE1ZS_06305, partial [Candidatus Poribacteria bacterium]